MDSVKRPAKNAVDDVNVSTSQKDTGVGIAKIPLNNIVCSSTMQKDESEDVAKTSARFARTNRLEESSNQKELKDIEQVFDEMNMGLSDPENSLEDIIKETDALLLFSNEALGALMRRTWFSGQQLKYKKMLVQHVKMCAVLKRDLQSGTEEKEDGGGIVQTPTLVCADENEGAIVNFNPIADNSFYADYTPGAELSRFLSRPVLINSVTWTEGTELGPYRFSPWHNYFNDARIAKKIDNYAFISCNLHVKVMINASPFYYGLGIMHYLPLASHNASGFAPNPAILGAIKDLQAANIIGSQRPHIWIYPQCNRGGEMTLPFLYYKNWLRVKSDDDFEKMGMLELSSATVLLNANSVSGAGVTIQVYAWAEDVRLAGPTVALALQSGKPQRYGDEYTQDGVVSGPASAVAKVTNALGEVPVLGPYFTATSIVAGGIARAAAWLGFSNPPNITKVDPIKNTPFHGMASSEISTPVEKLTLDPKNELSVDPRVVGLGGKDELMISNFTQKESFLVNYDWDLSDAVDTVLFWARVHPEMIHTKTADSMTIRYATPMAHIQHLFSYWRGDIIFRFRFICTQYHRGRARITYDPTGDILADAVTSTVAFTRIVDISDEPDIEIRVPYMQALPWCQTYSTTNTEYYDTTGSSITLNEGIDNGIICVRVFTKATSPVAVAPIKLIVSVRGAENLEFAAPKEPPRTQSVYALQSGKVCKYDSPIQVCINDGEDITEDNHRFVVNHGERIVSLRQLMRRTMLSRVAYTSVDTTAKDNFITQFFSRSPLFYGFDTNGIHAATKPIAGGSGAFNFCFNTFYNWIAPCFIGQRGSHRWTINVDSPAEIATIRTSRNRQGRISTDYQQSAVLATGTNIAQTAREYVNRWHPGGSGSTLNNQHTQTGISFEAPLYSQYRMVTTNPIYNTLGTSIDGTDQDTLRLDMILKPAFNSELWTQSTEVQYYHSIGTDFTLLFMVNIPPIVTCNLPAATP